MKSPYLAPSILLLLAVLGFTVPVAAQWTLDCQSANHPSQETYSTIYVYPITIPFSYSHSYRIYLMDSLNIHVYSYSHCAPSLEATYQLQPVESAANYRYLQSTNVDLNGDGRYEMVLSWTTYQNPRSYTAFKVFDIYTGTVFYTTSVNPAMDYDFAGISDDDEDGTLECLILATDTQTGSWHYEILSTGVPASSPEHRPLGPQFSMKQNYPNPFNPTTRIEYSIAQPGHVTLDVFNINGQRVTSLVNTWLEQGEHSLEWNSIDEHGIPLASGSYLYQVSVDGKPFGTRRMILLR